MRISTYFALVLAPLWAADTVQIPLTLQAQTIGPWHVIKAFVDVPNGAVAPKLISAPQTIRWATSAVGLLSVSFQIDEQGIPRNIHTDGSADPEIIDEVIAMIREWRFEAALRDDKAVISDAHIDFSGRPRAYKKKPQQ